MNLQYCFITKIRKSLCFDLKAQTHTLLLSSTSLSNASYLNTNKNTEVRFITNESTALLDMAWKNTITTVTSSVFPDVKTSDEYDKNIGITNIKFYNLN